MMKIQPFPPGFVNGGAPLMADMMAVGGLE
jgi:hypothetical protein